MLNARTRYGLKALVHLARQNPDQLVTAADMATEHGIPKRFLDSILTQLRHAGLVVSRRARYGGYRLAGSPDDILVWDILVLLGEPLPAVPCGKSDAYSPCEGCSFEACEVRLFMQRIRDAIDEIATGTTLRELAQSATKRRAFELGIKIAAGARG